MPGPTPITGFHTGGPHNVMVPAATGRVVEFARDPATFPVLRYVELSPVDKMNGVFPEINAHDPVTVVTRDDNLWADGQERPEGAQVPFRWKDYSCTRHAYDFTIGSLTADQADWDIVSSNARAKASTAMTDRTLEVYSLLSASGSWDAANVVADVATLIGTAGDWDASSVAEQFIKKSFNAARNAIKLGSGGAAGTRGVTCTVNPDRANLMGGTAEVQAYLVNHETAMQNLSQIDQNQLSQYGLPPILYGVRMVVEDSVRQTTRRDEDGSGTRDWTWASDDIAVFTTMDTSNVGNDDVAIRRNAAAASYSTCVMFEQEAMNVEIQTDSWNRRVMGSVVDNRVAKVAASPSGLLLQDVSAA